MEPMFLIPKSRGKLFRLRYILMDKEYKKQSRRDIVPSHMDGISALKSLLLFVQGKGWKEME
jgi:hypothetical protein